MSLFFDIFKISLTSLWSNKIRSGLSLLGIIIGILTISTLLSIAFGVRKEVSSQVEDLGSNLIVVVPGKIQGSSGGFNPTAGIGASTLTEDDFKKIEEDVPEVKNVSMAMLISGTVRAGEKISTSSLILASTDKILPALNSQVSEGSSINQDDISKNARVIVLGPGPVKELFGEESPLSKVVDIRGEDFEVIGVLKEKETAESFLGPSFNDVVIMPITTGWEITKTKQVFRIMMQAPDSGSVKAVQEKVKKIVLENHNDEEDFSVLTQEDILGLLGKIFNILTAMLGAVAIISLVVGGIGIMNIMLVSVSERTKEIGIRKAVGATNTNILLQFLMESVTLTILAGIVAIILFYAGVSIASSHLPVPIEVTPQIVILALVFSAIVGVVFGVIPALQASRKNPIEALRYE